MIFLTCEEWMERIGENLKARRLRENLSQQTLAARSGVSLNAVKNLESGRGASVFARIGVPDAWGGGLDRLARPGVRDEPARNRAARPDAPARGAAEKGAAPCIGP